MSEKKIHNVGVVILAAGDGKRMKSTLPKMMHELKGKPLIQHVVEHVEQSGIGKPLIVVSSKHSMVQDCIGERAEYVVQKEQLGTGHAASMAETILKGTVEHVIFLNGDMPFVSGESIKRLLARHTERKNTITMMTVVVPNFDNENQAFAGFGRIVRGKNGHIARIVEKKDASEEELGILELNPSVWCFEASWLWKSLKNLKNENSQKEYYLTDLIGMGIDEGVQISSISIEPKEAIGINTAEDLEVAKGL
ncbi:MAG TPA: NTP transferase domain-containing protein [Candidatus Magasanikbacteria bacterium]|nr:NTP transferase domain-containing protein [Candidatus Magasanikbacteria bacterium]